MSSDLEKLAAIETATKQKLKEIKQKKKAIERAENEEKKLAIGDGIQCAVKAGDLQWQEIKVLLRKHVKSKKSRKILELDN